jgi:hypothetical protein
MLENNYEFLANQLEQIGYNENRQLGLINKIMLDYSQFTIRHKVMSDQDIAMVSMQFEKSGESGMYLFKNYIIEVEQAGSKEAQKQTFDIEEKDNITLKEAYNLLLGRAIYKEFNTLKGDKHNAWVQLDYKDTDEDGNLNLRRIGQKEEFNLYASIERYPIKELKNNYEKKQLVESLESGNRTSATYIQGDTEKKIFIEAVPQFNAIHIFDADMKRLKPEQLLLGKKHTF